MNAKSIYKKLKKTFAEKGARGAYAAIWSSFGDLSNIASRKMGLHSKDSYDKAHDVDTSGVVPMWMLDVKHDAIDLCIQYQPTPVEVFDRASAHFPPNHNSYTFIDAGAGKGRVVMLAARYPFRKIIGIEISESLCNVARKNITIASGPDQKCNDVEMICEDASRFQFPKGNVVIYLYNPFGGKLLASFMSNLLKDTETESRHILVIYFNPQEREIIEQTGHLHPVVEADDLVIYTNK